ncbi:hypothetical protein J6590_070845 [Homalodisca vitripennis]|nr:hypothetical protein J6590_070845 [Homalodisca vitripennis]
MEKLLAEFKSRLQTKPDLPEVKSIMKEIERKGEQEFKGDSIPEFIERLKKDLEQLMNSAVIEKICNSYKEEFLTPNSTRRYHDHIWPSIVNLLNQYICGDGSTRIKAKENAVQGLNTLP